MKEFILVGFLASVLHGFSLASPAGSILNSSVSGYTVKESNVKNQSNISNSRFENIGIDQVNVIHTIKIRKGVDVKNTTVENESYMAGSEVNSRGKGQDNNVGSIDLGNAVIK